MLLLSKRKFWITNCKLIFVGLLCVDIYMLCIFIFQVSDNEATAATMLSMTDHGHFFECMVSNILSTIKYGNKLYQWIPEK